MTVGPLILKRASASRLSGECGDDDYDVLADGAVVGRILKVHAAPVGTLWMWTHAFGLIAPPDEVGAECEPRSPLRSWMINSVRVILQ
jgi:hypothetical protein